MKTRQLFYTLTFFFLLSPVIAGAQENNTKMDQFIDRLMSKMTLKEKIGQLDPAYRRKHHHRGRQEQRRSRKDP
jgi:hypothetical protein